MKNKIVEVPSIRQPIMSSPGFAKKELSDYKLDLLALCGFGCRYCSSNHGNYLRINQEPFAKATEAQLGRRILPDDDPSLMLVWPDVIEKLEAQLRGKPKTWGAGKTLVFSMLTDGFSPWLIEQGITRRALDLVLAFTSFRIRVLTKNAAVGFEPWRSYFVTHRDRFVVGLSCGTLDDDWAKRVEIGTSPPSERLAALHALQLVGVPTYGMLCPVFPDALGAAAYFDGRTLEGLINGVRPQHCEHVWAEPYNDRANWQHVRDGYKTGSAGWNWMTEVYEQGRADLWSQYATQLYVRLRAKAAAEGWLSKLRYLLYEAGITMEHARTFAGLDGVLLQSKPTEDGRSSHPGFAVLARA